MEDWRRIDQLVSIILVENNQLFIPGLGTIKREIQGAKFLAQKNQFIPPSTHYTLDRSLHYDDPYLSELYSQYEQVSLAEAEAEVYNYGTKINRQLILKGESMIHGFGRLVVNEQQITIEPGIPFQQSHRLPTIDLDDIWTSNNSGGQSVWWETSAFIGILVMVLGYMYYLIYVAPIHTIFPYNENTPAIIGKQTAPPPDVDKEDAGPMLPDTLSDTQLVTNPPTSPQLEDTLTTYAPIIIVGVFENPTNLKKMSRLLTSRGWEVYQEPINGKLVRLGFIPEEHENIEEVLGLVRKDIEPEAWLLVKEH